jgi:hypothetical protein
MTLLTLCNTTNGAKQLTGNAMRRTMKKSLIISLLAITSTSFANITTFDDLSFANGSVENGSNLSGGFVSSGLGFNNSYDPTYDAWSGFGYSKVQDGVTSGFGNQYAAKPGVAHSGNNYGVAFDDLFTPFEPTISVPIGQRVTGLFITNTTYAYFSMHDGDAFAKKFGGATGNDADWFKVTAMGLNGSSVTGTADFYLADYRSANNADDYIVSEWRFFDLSGLGSASSVKFSLSSSDNGAFGMNTPAYFAIDDVSTVPEPATFVAVGTGIFGLIRRRRGGKSLS